MQPEGRSPGRADLQQVCARAAAEGSQQPTQHGGKLRLAAARDGAQHVQRLACSQIGRGVV